MRTWLLSSSLFLAAAVALSATGCSSDCPAPQIRCGALCVDPRIDPTNCGLCGVSCMSGQICSSGKCGIPCPTGQGCDPEKGPRV